MHYLLLYVVDVITFIFICYAFIITDFYLMLLYWNSVKHGFTSQYKIVLLLLFAYYLFLIQDFKFSKDLSYSLTFFHFNLNGNSLQHLLQGRSSGRTSVHFCLSEVVLISPWFLLEMAFSAERFSFPFDTSNMSAYCL